MPEENVILRALRISRFVFAQSLYNFCLWSSLPACRHFPEAKISKLLTNFSSGTGSWDNSGGIVTRLGDE
jgi:hypothetical protein